MTEFSGASAVGSGTAREGHRWAAIARIPLAFALIAGASFSVTLFSFSAPSGADQVSALQAQAAQLSSQMLLEQLQIGGYQQQYTAAVARVRQDTTVAARTRDAIERDQDRIHQDTSELETTAVTAYEDSGSAADATPLFTDQKSDGNRTEYEGIATGSVSVDVDQLRSDRLSLRAHQAVLQAVQAQDEQSQSDASSLLQQSQNTEQQLQQQSALVKGQLAAAVTQQQAEQAAAAAAAVAAAQSKAAAQQAVEDVQVDVGVQSDPRGASTATPALPPFLQCVIQAESGGDYQAVSPNGEYMGAFQFSQPTWNEAAQLAGQPDLVGVPPDQATPAQQDDLAIALYDADGSQPWYDPCTSS